MKKLLLSAGMLLACYQTEAQVVPASDSSLLASTVRMATRRYLTTAPESRLINGGSLR